MWLREGHLPSSASDFFLHVIRVIRTLELKKDVKNQTLLYHLTGLYYTPLKPVCFPPLPQPTNLCDVVGESVSSGCLLFLNSTFIPGWHPMCIQMVTLVWTALSLPATLSKYFLGFLLQSFSWGSDWPLPSQNLSNDSSNSINLQNNQNNLSSGLGAMLNGLHAFFLLNFVKKKIQKVVLFTDEELQIYGWDLYKLIC